MVARERSLFNLDATVYLSDLTSSDFEGQRIRNVKAKRGYSRDHRPDSKQVVVGLVVSREGFPITHKVSGGNAQDRTTLGTIPSRHGDYKNSSRLDTKQLYHAKSGSWANVDSPAIDRPTRQCSAATSLQAPMVI